MQKVRVYWNLHRKVWSVQDVKSGRVCDHLQHISLTDAKFVVRKGGQKRVREEGKKNVHAFAVGTGGCEKGVATRYDGRPVTYNPYKNDTFVFADTGEPVTDVHVISVFTHNGKPEVYALPKSDSGLTQTN